MDLEINFTAQNLAKAIYDNKIKHAVKFAHTIIAISEQTKKDIIEFYQVAENKIEVIYQACDAIFEKKQTSVEINLIKETYALPANYLLYVGTIEERKNALVILQAMLALPSHVKLVMVGKKKSYGLIIDAFIKKHELNDRVIQINQVDFKDLPAIYQAATIFIYPSKFEGFGIPIIEALHSETPVIAAKGSCLAEAGGPNSLYFEPSNAEELTGLIADLLADESKQKSMAASGKKYVEKFNGEKIATELMGLYQSILSR